MISQALIPRLFPSELTHIKGRLLAVSSGVGLMFLLAQVAIPLPFTPVPVTGQTFGLLFVSLLWGRRLGFETLLLYIGLGALGLPLFAQFKSGLAGATSGYLLGMLAASYVIGSLADRGWGRTYVKAVLAGALGLAVVFACGLLILRYFIPEGTLLSAGLYPFVPGAILKLLLASGLSAHLNRSATKDGE
ncbi:MAG: biotin transporter BioY [Bdellovibrionaceae bacterium]|nr:biotin transporter BioY [Bdellovibrionales bacterium]MCB9083303.1 biotin transporter BioY [Pseudobdellovibrionaceae bacterium]